MAYFGTNICVSINEQYKASFLGIIAKDIASKMKANKTLQGNQIGIKGRHFSQFCP